MPSPVTRRTLFALAFLAFLPPPLGAQADSPHFAVEPVGEGVWAVVAADSGDAICNAGVVDLGDATVVFDPFISPIPAEDLRRAAEELTGRTVDFVVLSHWHNDHIRGTQAFPGARVVATAKTRTAIAEREPRVIEREKEQVGGWLERERGRLAAADPEQRAEHRFWVDYYDAIDRSFRTLRTILPDSTFDGRLVLRGSERDVALIEHRGHTESDLVLHVPEARVAFLGDLLFVERHPYLPDGEPDDVVRAMRAVEALGLDRVVPGHGPVRGPEALRTMAEYIQATAERGVELVGDSATLEQVRTLDPPPPYDSWWYGRFYLPNLWFMVERAAET